MRVGVIDSGIGGLSVLKKLIEVYPNNEYIYFGDTLNNPYGNKTHEKIFLLSCKAINFLLSKNCELIIIACGTISSTVFKRLKENFNIPLIDIISPTIDYFSKNNFSNLKVIATFNTIKSNVFGTIKGIKQEYSNNLAKIIEDGASKEDIKNELSLIIDDNDSNLILGCTHYPFILDIIKEKYPSIKVFDMASFLVDYIKLLDSNYSLEIYFSKISENNMKIVNHYFKNFKVGEYNA